ncbi:MAG: S9 family peptidase [Ignavibacteria bacterium]|nr:S9 family peptidase [Ignavibacteria bacterium]
MQVSKNRYWNLLGLAGFVICLAFSKGLAEKKRAWTNEDSFKMKSIRDLSVSPDNELLLFVVSERDVEDNRYYSSIWILPTKGGEPKPLTKAKGGDSNPRWSPNGEGIAFFSSDDGGSGLWVMNRDGSQKRKITNFETSNAYLGSRGNKLSWSPDGKRIAYNAAGPRYYANKPTPEGPPNGNDVLFVDRLLYKAFYYYSDMRRTYVWVISADGGNPEQICFGDYDYHSISWSPDGKWIACASNRTGKDDFNANNDICLLSTEGKELVQLTHTIGPEYQMVWSRDGSRIAYLGRERDHRSKESDAELKKVYVMSVSGGSPVNLTAPLDRWSSSPQWSSDGSTVYFTAQNSGKIGLYAAPVEGGTARPVMDEVGQVTSYCLGEDGEIFYVFTDNTQPPEIYRTNMDGGGKRKLTELNTAFAEEVEITKSERFSYPSFDGLDIEGWILRPYNFEPNKKYPMVFAVHGGPHGQYGYRISGQFQLYAANGYVVVFTNPRGSTGRGQKFSDMCVGDLAGGDYKDLMAGVDYVLGTYEFIDPDQLGVTGGSYGGYMANWIVTQTDRFKASVAISSISNLISAWSQGCNSLWFESDMGFIPFEDYERAWAASPLKYVKNCRTPTLFINGAWDFCTHVSQAEEMFTALKKLGVDAVLAIYPNEGHGVRNQPRHTFDYHERALAWFDKYLK